MKLIGTPRSHFTRKVRLLLDHWDAPYAFEDVGDVSQADPARFCGNPAMSIPVLEEGAVWLIESDHIAQHLSKRFDPQDRLKVRRSDPETLNRRAILNTIMSQEVKLVLGKRTGLETQGAAYFDKARAAILHGLDWLEVRADTFDAEAPGYGEFHFIAAWEHLALYDTVPLTQPRLKTLADRLAARPLIAKSAYPPLPV
ncbi:glutathione S-transferase family protein [Oceanicaulis sp. LC35]|uniref:glutathione S-transferase family protein n=1 Tax=Oceanicaulis sp. LC35 TaxID=3349635 RepID=UPI003F87D771